MESILNNRYRLVLTLSNGKFGNTFLAEDFQTYYKYPCVIKQLIPTNSSPEVYPVVQERYQTEVSVLKELGAKSEQIPTIYNSFEIDGQFYLVQEWIEGETLKNLVQTKGILHEKTVKEILFSLLIVLNYIHSQGVIHQDIKPENIILRQIDSKPVLINFAVVKAAMATVITPAGKITNSIAIGTKGYMPGEQAANHPTYKSDLYSLGLTAIYLLTGKIPKELETNPVTGEIIWRKYSLNISAEFANVLDKAIKYDARDRYSSAKELLAELQSISTPIQKVNFSKNIIFSLITGSLISTFIFIGIFLTRPLQPHLKQTQTAVKSTPSTIPFIPPLEAKAPVKLIPISNIKIPEPKREFRGAWVATVINIDWPSQAGLSSQQQQAELINILDRAVALKLNAVIFQVRPAADALYKSEYEPWSESLTGQMGKAPEPFYDPLEFAVQEAHKRGLELHAWFNPYRAYHAKAKSPISDNHISKIHPEWVKKSGNYLWLDPGEIAVQEYNLQVFMDVLRRYDIDGIHIDDYFYPANNSNFADERSWQKYIASGGKLNRDDWRRENVNVFIESLYKNIKKEKPWVKFGISPFGIWKSGYPEQIKGLSPYYSLYADSRKWLQEGWLDYFSPQLYWKINQKNQSYPVLLSWWVKQNTKKRHIWPGNYTGLVNGGDGIVWPADEILEQIYKTRSLLGATGNIHFSMKALMSNSQGIGDLLSKKVYNSPALVPASSWLENTPPTEPELSTYKDPVSGKIYLVWQHQTNEQVGQWLVQIKKGKEWHTQVLPALQNNYPLGINKDIGEVVAVSAINRYGTQGAIAIRQLQP